MPDYTTVELVPRQMKEKLVAEIRAANASILAVQTWFTDRNLFDELKAKAAAGLKVDVAVSNEGVNLTLPFSDLTENGAQVVFVDRHRIRGAFCVLDNDIVAVGSYNWTYRGATDAFKNLFLLRKAPEFAHKCRRVFEQLSGFSGQVHNAEPKYESVELALRLSAVLFEIEQIKKRVDRRGQVEPDDSVSIDSVSHLYNQCLVAICQAGFYIDTDKIEVMLQAASDAFHRGDSNVLKTLRDRKSPEGSEFKNYHGYLVKEYNNRMRMLRSMLPIN